MGSKDFLTAPKIISNSLVYDQKEFYNYLKRWFSLRSYDINEGSYTEKILANGKKLYSFVWMNDKRVDDYTKFVIGLDFSAEVENIQIELHDGKKKTAQKGTITLKFTSFIEKDADLEWTIGKKTAYRAIFMEIYDKIIAKGKWARYQTNLGKDFNALMGDVKTYLKMHRYD